ncbi:hypothetical protein BS78_08G047000 [Paspalum vaginatum]|nr:hypothetical protein BS78_08G047000 [Paspalum vaginatum]
MAPSRLALALTTVVLLHSSTPSVAGDSTTSSVLDTTSAVAAGRRHGAWSWPEVVGMPVKEAKEIILRDRPGARVVVVPPGYSVTQACRRDRVRIFVDAAVPPTVTHTPRIG